MDEEIARRAAECAKFAGIGESTLRLMGRRGLIPVVRVGVSGRGVRFIVRDVMAALKNRSAHKGRPVSIDKG